MAPQRRGVQFAAGVQRLFDEMFDRVALIDDHVPLILLDHLLDLRRLMTRHDGKSVPLATNTLVLLERHQNADFASAGVAALTLEVELLFGCSPIGALVDVGDPLIHGTDEIFVSSLPLEPFLHTADPTAPQTAAVAGG